MLASMILLGQVALLPSPVVRGHSHNDYWRKRPLAEALEAGMCSIEADVFLIDGKLKVGHDLAEATAGKTLEELYLDPLARRELVDGKLAKGWPEVILLVDVKAEGEKVFPVLEKLVKERSRVFSTDKDVRAVRVVVSGDRPVELILGSQEGWLALDGRRSDLGKKIPVRRMPMVSESWSYVGWNKNVDLPEENLIRALNFTKYVFAEGKKSRFWGVPDRPDYWSLMKRLAVDWVNTDRPGELREWELQG
ncbi:hypothetical protein C0431_12040 [bacterium]|nr:hypothetical protein [bacterium]